jgi:diaminohydroxyphosphoribosylaminopyrimidine deaminase/5-amino-6-(5-phosphoribosylamino)uracil reductase
MIFRLLEDQVARDYSARRAADRRFMQLALTLGAREQGRTWPNPAVGAVVVSDGIVVGRGWTQPGGRPHAEPLALAQAGAAARGATLYATLEPCAHHGRSPPCTDAIIAAGIARVVSAVEDPNPEVAGQGHARLRAAGIAVDTGIGAAEAARAHAGHFRRIQDGCPHVMLKLALSADGRIGAAGRQPVALTGAAAGARVHLMRAHSDAIMIGIGTALADGPLLTCRLPGMAAWSPVRVVLDSQLRLPPLSRLAQGAREVPLWLFTAQPADAPPAAALAALGVEIVPVAAGGGGLDLPAVLRELARRGITRLMVEGGAQLAGQLVARGLVDEARLFQTEVAIGADGVDALEGQPLTAITASAMFAKSGAERIGADRLTIYQRR